MSDKTKFQDFWNEYKVLNQVLEDFPATIVTDDYQSSDMNEIVKNVGGKNWLFGLTTFYEFNIRNLYFTNIYKIKAVVESINGAL